MGAFHVHMLTCRGCAGLTPAESSSTCLHCDAPLQRPPRRARIAALLAPASAILLAACYGASGRYREPKASMPDGLMRADRDHDGAAGPYECQPHAGDCASRLAAAPAADNLDCDDANASVFPGAADVDGDNVDGNCDGVDGWADPARRAAPPPAGAAAPTPAPAHVIVQPASP
jgi:hypothetical protein